MAVTVRVPLVLTRLTEGKKEVQVGASSVRDLVDRLDAAYPGLKSRLCDETGQIRQLLNFYVNEKDIRYLKGADTELEDGDLISIVPMMAGG